MHVFNVVVMYFMSGGRRGEGCYLSVATFDYFPTSSSGKNSLTYRYLVETTPVYGTGSIILIQNSRLCVRNLI